MRDQAMLGCDLGSVSGRRLRCLSFLSRCATMEIFYPDFLCLCYRIPFCVDVGLPYLVDAMGMLRGF